MDLEGHAGHVENLKLHYIIREIHCKIRHFLIHCHIGHSFTIQFFFTYLFTFLLSISTCTYSMY